MNDQATPPGPGIAIDPVCGMHVVIDGAQNIFEHEGTTYYFCAKGCRLDFEDDPARILAPDYRPSM
ncbi:MAG: YHS domain-containing protein [Chloroflexota bacterium]|nr:YHS domain-containing protein [Chloroflexota bacterium]